MENKQPAQCFSFRLSLYMVRLLFVFLAVFAFFLPYILKNFTHFVAGDDSLFPIMLLVIYSSYVPFYVALFSLHGLLMNIRRDILFENKNVRFLTALSWCCFAVAVLYGLFAVRYIWSLFAALLGCLMWMVLRVLKNVFDKAVYMKHENDLTV